MSIQLLNIGFGNMVSANRVIAIISPESAPIKRMVQDARDKMAREFAKDEVLKMTVAKVKE